MKKLAVLAIALGSVAIACTSPTTLNVVSGAGGSGNTGNEGGSGNTGNIGGGNGGEGGLDTGSTTEPVKDPTARDMYIAEVYPSLMSTCGACHIATGLAENYAFLDNDMELSYVMTKGYPNFLKLPAESLLINQPAHTGPALTDGQKATVGKWLDMEIKEGGGTVDPTSGAGTTPPKAKTLDELLAEFAACMDFDVWEATGMALFPDQQTNGQGACKACHNQGVGAVWLSGDPLETFDMNKQFPYIMRLVTPVYEGVNPVDLVMANRFLTKGNEICQNGTICHPKFELSPTNKAAFQDFVSKTLQKWATGQCVINP